MQLSSSYLPAVVLARQKRFLRMLRLRSDIDDQICAEFRIFGDAAFGIATRIA
jgi:hypothetical protein